MQAGITELRQKAYQLRQSYQYEEARQLLEQGLSQFKNPAETWALHYELGKNYQENFNMDKALHHYQCAIDDLKSEGGHPSVFLGRLYAACGLVCQDKGLEVEAIRCHHRAVAVLRQVPEEEGALFLASNLKYLGELYQEQSALAESREHYRPALSLLQQRLGKGEGFLYLEAATVALQLAAVEVELLMQSKIKGAQSARQLLEGAAAWLQQLDGEDSIVEQRQKDMGRLSRMLDKLSA